MAEIEEQSESLEYATPPAENGAERAALNLAMFSMWTMGISFLGLGLLAVMVDWGHFDKLEVILIAGAIFVGNGFMWAAERINP